MRDALAPYLDKRIYFEGYYDYGNDLYVSNRINKTALFQDIVAMVNERELIVGHGWVQHANSVMNLKPKKGDKIGFTAVVTRYLKKLDTPNKDNMMTEYRFGIDAPHDADFIGVGGYGDNEPVERQPIMRAPLRPVQAPTADVFALLPDIKALADRMGKEAMASVLPHLPELTTMATKAGGADRLAALLQFLI